MWHDSWPVADHDPLRQHPARQFRALHDRLDTLERHQADLMFLQLSAQELLLGNRLEFTGLGRSVTTKVVAAEPFGGQCPCCLRERNITEAGRVVPGAEFDPFFHRGLEQGRAWVVDLRRLPRRADP